MNSISLTSLNSLYQCNQYNIAENCSNQNQILCLNLTNNSESYPLFNENNSNYIIIQPTSQNQSTSISYSTGIQSDHVIQQDDINLGLNFDVDSIIESIPGLKDIDRVKNDSIQINTANIDDSNQYQSNNYIQMTNPTTECDQIVNFNTHDQSQLKLATIPLNLTDNVIRTEPKSTVDILNEILASKSNQNYPESSRNGISSVRISNRASPYNLVNRNDQHIESKLKTMKSKDDIINCNVCGQESSGYHYGSYTCEACKLFFRRTEKQIRKTGFTQCKTKNCLINFETRANCSECRYKKCIAVGMAMSRSRFGRHTEKLATNYTPNLTESLITQLNNTKYKWSSIQSQPDFFYLNQIILEFYNEIIKTLALNNNNHADISEEMLKLPVSYQQASIINSISIIQYNNYDQQILPNPIIILFAVLFDINIDMFSFLSNIQKEFSFQVQSMENRLIDNKNFNMIFKIGIFIKILRSLFVAQSSSTNPFDKQINDMLRSELSTLKFESINSNNQQSMNNLNSNPEDNSVLLDKKFSLVFSKLNLLVKKHLGRDEFRNVCYDRFRSNNIHK